MMQTELLAPTDRAGLCAALQRATQSSRLVAGGTDLMLQLREGNVQPDVIIDLSALRELVGVQRDQGRIFVGAMTTFAQLQDHPELLAHARCLAQAAGQVGSVQIRNCATIGGNVANASPCGDAIAALLALGANVTTIDADAKIRERALAEVLQGNNRTSLTSNEAITGFSFPALPSHGYSAFAKVGARSMVTVSKLNAAMAVEIDPQARIITRARVALGSIAGTAVRERDVEAVLVGKRADEATARDFGRACADAVRRSIAERPSMPYKQHAALGLAQDVWNALQICPPCGDW
jgi:CO/xanthine dehydrogenase FAD-binding subunit